ncbi:MAG: tRNA uracil 4-sulfurtransferase ThiI [Nitrososphaeria archaeon]
MDFDAIVVHYGEIGVKGRNRFVFEKILMNNIKNLLDNFETEVYKRYGRIVCRPKFKEEATIRKALEALPGIEYFAFAFSSELSFDRIQEKAIKLLNDKDFATFKVEARRSNKSFPLNSFEINNRLGASIASILNKSVSMKPDIKLYVEICEKEAFLYTEKCRGLGGLPVGSSGKVVSLISGGIDSPVASFFMMKRGCNVVFVHFYNRIINSETAISKLERVVSVLTKFQLKSKLYIIPFEKLQMEVVKGVPSKYRMIIYRRAMDRVANVVAQIEGAKALITGDSLGQVASQTLENLNVIHEASNIQVFTPLIGLDKVEIVNIAKKIGTYEYSILPYQDCCSFMLSPHPVTRSCLEEVKKLEANIKFNPKEYLEGSRTLEFKYKF